MVLPTWDKETVTLVDKAVRKRCSFDWDGYCVAFSPDGMAREIIGILEQQGYYKGDKMNRDARGGYDRIQTSEEPLEIALQQALEGVHSGSVRKIERRLNIGGVVYVAKIYGMNDAARTVRVDLAPQGK